MTVKQLEWQLHSVQLNLDKATTQVKNRPRYGRSRFANKAGNASFIENTRRKARLLERIEAQKLVEANNAA